MPRYYFDLMDHECVLDDVGVELADDTAARIEAVHYGGRYLADHPELIWDGREIRVHVIKDQRQTVYIVVILGIDAVRPNGRFAQAAND